MILSKNTKQQMITQLVKKYGKNYKTPLAKSLGVNVSTIRRMFNNDKDLTPSNEIAINCIINHQSFNAKDITRLAKDLKDNYIPGVKTTFGKILEDDLQKIVIKKMKEENAKSTFRTVRHAS